MPSKWDTLVPEGADDRPVAGATRFDPSDPYENRAGPFWSTPVAAAARPDAETEGEQPGEGTKVQNGWGDPTPASNTFWLRVQERHCNSGDIVHGGLLMTLADCAMAYFTPNGRFLWSLLPQTGRFGDDLG